VRNLWVVGRLRGAAHPSPETCVAIETMLTGVDASQQVAAGVRHAWPEIARPSFRLALQCKGVDLGELLSSGLMGGDAALAREAARAGRGRLQAEARSGWIRRLCSHRSSFLRRVGLVELASGDPATAEPMLQEALFDSRAIVRSFARSSLARLGRVDVSDSYRAIVQRGADDTRRLAGASTRGETP
jgi:hypothetical protein